MDRQSRPRRTVTKTSALVRVAASTIILLLLTAAGSSAYLNVAEYRTRPAGRATAGASATDALKPVTTTTGPGLRNMLSGLGAGAAFSSARAALQAGGTINVNTTAEDPAGPGDCTLRLAITAANTDRPAGGCPAGSGPDTINLPILSSNYLLTKPDNTDTFGANGLPVITSTITINAPQRQPRIERSGGPGTPEFRLFHVAPGGDLTVIGFTLDGGAQSSVGGGVVLNRGGRVRIFLCDLSNNRGARGGAVLSRSA